MSLKSKLKIESIGMFTAFVFYAIVGIVWFAVLPMANFPPHIGLLAIFSLITAYGVFKKRIWATWLVVMLFFVVTTFSAYMLYYFVWENIFLGISMIAYLVLTWIFTTYIAIKRKTLTS